MPKVLCAAMECKFHSTSDNYCRAREINLADNYVHTVHDGPQHYNRCRTYEPSSNYEELTKQFAEFFLTHHYCK